MIASGAVFSYGVDPGAPEMSQGEIAAVEVGAIEAGRYGDLIAVQGDPLQDVGLFKNIPVEFKGGLVFKLGNPPN